MEFKKFFLKVSSFTLGTLISRITGLFREMVFAYLFGASYATDCFNIAFRIPNLLRDMFSESALSAAFVPTFCEKMKGKEKRNMDYSLSLFASNVLNFLILIVGIITLLLILFSFYVVKIISFGFAQDLIKFNLTLNLTRIMLPFLFFISLASWAMGILIAYGYFFVSAVSSAIFNILSILIPLFTYTLFLKLNYEPILSMAYGVLFGSLFQFLFLIIFLKRLGYRYYFYLSLKDEALRKVFKLYLPVIFGLAAYQINFFVNTILITFLEEKSITYLNYAYRVMHLPAGLFGVAVGSVALQEFSFSEKEEIKDNIFVPIKINTLLLIPASLIFIILSLPITRILYERGRFSFADSYYTAIALSLYSLLIFPSSLVRVFASLFYSLKNTKTPALIGFLSVFLNISLNLLLMRKIGFKAFPISASLATFFQAIILYFLLKKKVGIKIINKETKGFFLKTSYFLILFSLSLYFFYHFFNFLKISYILSFFLTLLISGFIFLSFLKKMQIF
ncbi:MAG: murein biosynthesis integral membrane protein MurJ [candidate division WOR-3 bacterium]|nr:murein biosynthesis integral membrane protein MurJ [candidate division WOR-3 bacterium]MCX7836529.1 murein biosynthesis integral membrane protein MurJ [candidate division WOR-3 bacterium]MDW8113767.1 murein biosynthesis integral membrane protein MurJ [candidate division WOR-3 bacterium]